MFGGLPDKIWIIFVGLGMLGWFVSMMYVLVTPEIIDASGGDVRDRWTSELRNTDMTEDKIQKTIRKRWKLAKGVMTDKASALANMAFALGSMIGPIVGGQLTDAYGYRKCSDIITILALSAACINFIVIFVPDLIKGKQRPEVSNSETEEETPIGYQ